MKLVRSKPTQQRQIWLHGLCRDKNSKLCLGRGRNTSGNHVFCGKLGAAECGSRQGLAEDKCFSSFAEFLPLKISPTVFEEFSKASSWNLILKKNTHRGKCVCSCQICTLTTTVKIRRGSTAEEREGLPLCVRCQRFLGVVSKQLRRRSHQPSTNYNTDSLS